MFSFAKTKRLIYYYSTIKMRLKPLCRRYFDNGRIYEYECFCKPNTDSFGPKECRWEFSFEYHHQYDKGSFSAGYGQFTYDSNPNVSINNDAVATVENTNHSILNCASKKYKQAGMPQQAYGLGIDYRDPKYWWVESILITCR
jgi:hypothetical protein